MADKNQADRLLKEHYLKYGDKIRKFCFARLSNDDFADDCVQETFVVLYKQLLKGAEIENVGAFLYKTADNFVKQRWREKKKSEKTVPIDELSETLSAPVVEFSEQDNDYDAFAAELLKTLSDSEKELYTLRYVDKKPISEISKQMETTVGAVTMRIKRLREKVKQLAEKFVSEEEYSWKT